MSDTNEHIADLEETLNAMTRDGHLSDQRMFLAAQWLEEAIGQLKKAHRMILEQKAGDGLAV